MSGIDAVEDRRVATANGHRLNFLSQPLGHAVTEHTSDHPDIPLLATSPVHRIDHHVAQGPSLDTVGAVRAYPEELAKLPRWRLDLDDDSIEFDTTTLKITDKQTGQSFCLKAWKSFEIAGVIAGDQTPRAPAGVRHISVVAQHPPTIGHWYNCDND